MQKPATFAAKTSVALILAIALAVGAYLRVHKLTRPPVDLATQVVEARSYVERKNFQKAIEVLQQLLQQSPENADARSLLNEASQKQKERTIQILFLEAQTLRSQGNLKEARRTLEKILQFDPRNQEALKIRGQLQNESLQAKGKEDVLRENQGGRITKRKSRPYWQ